MSTVKNYKFNNNSIYHFPDPLYPGHPHTIWLLPRHHHLLAALLSSFETHQIPDHPKIRDLPRYSGDRSRLPVSPFQPPPFESPPKLQNCSLGTATTFQQPSLFWGLTSPQLVFHKRLSSLHTWLRETDLGIQQNFAGLGASSCPV